MNNQNISRNLPNDALSELRSEMQTLKNHVKRCGSISDELIRNAMIKKSSWLNNFVMGEILMIPLLAAFLIGVSISSGMNIWCMIVFVIIAIPSAIFDMRTMRVPKGWILDETFVGLSKKLVRQKLERKRQTLIESFLMVGWVCWYIYEFLKHNGIYLTGEYFVWAWIISTAFALIISFVIIWIIYRKAQRVNDDMIAKINSFVDE